MLFTGKYENFRLRAQIPFKQTRQSQRPLCMFLLSLKEPKGYLSFTSKTHKTSQKSAS